MEDGSSAEVRRHLKTYIVNELLKGEEPPDELSRRYYPTDTDIRNILYSSRMGERKGLITHPSNALQGACGVASGFQKTWRKFRALFI